MVVAPGTAERMSVEELGEVPICGMQADPVVLSDARGRLYHEVNTNIWMELGSDVEVAYVGTSRHAGGVVLRPMFVRRDGEWRNACTGRPVAFIAKGYMMGGSDA